MGFNDLAKEIYANAKEKGFWEAPLNFGEKIALMTAELSEALEEYRDGHGYTEIYRKPENPAKPEGIPVELADAIIRILDTCAAVGIDIEEAIEIKMAYNKSRSYKHGKKI